MAKYKVNEEGVQALQTMSKGLENAVTSIAGQCKQLSAMMDEYSGTIGPHASSLTSAIEGINSTLQGSTDDVVNVSMKLLELAGEYAAIIDNDPFTGTQRVRTR